MDHNQKNIKMKLNTKIDTDQLSRKNNFFTFIYLSFRNPWSPLITKPMPNIVNQVTAPATIANRKLIPKFTSCRKYDTDKMKLNTKIDTNQLSRNIPLFIFTMIRSLFLLHA